MLNEHQKNEFIEYYLSNYKDNKNQCYRYFKEFGEFEDKFNKDISEFSRDEIVTVYRGLKAASLQMLQRRTRFMAKYCRWLQEQKQNNDVVINEDAGEHPYRKEILIKPSEFDGMDTQFLTEQVVHKGEEFPVFTKEELLAALNREENKSINIRDKALILAVFEGFPVGSSKNFFYDYKIDTDQVKKLYMEKDGVKYPISPELSELILKAMDVTQYPYLSRSKVRYMDCYDNGTLLKDINGLEDHDKKMVLNYIQHVLLVSIKRLDPNANIQSLKYSGIIHEIKRLAELHGKFPNEVARTYSKDIAKKFGYKNFRGTLFFETYRPYFMK